VGSLQFDSCDVTTKNTVFRVIGSKALDAKPRPDKKQVNLAKAVKKIL
jgi:hypothetical protein